MAGKFIGIKKILPKKILPAVPLIMLAFPFSGCAAVNSNQMLDMINNNQSIAIEVANPSYEVEVQGEQIQSTEWVQLDQLQTYNKGFRQGFDEIFNINIVTENGVNGKSGCLFVDESGDRNGNTTLEDALRNKVFVNKYWEKEEVKSQIAKLSKEAYEDTGDSLLFGITGSINAYYNLLEDSVNPSSFNPTQSLTREQFYTLVFKTEEGVREIEVDKNFENAIGGETEHSKFAQEVDEYGFLSVENKSLDAATYEGIISRAEAVYMMVNKHFPDELAKVTGKEDAYKDTKNAGDLAYKLGFKYKDKETKEIKEKDRWQAYTLAVMVQEPKDGMQEELYKAMVVAKKLGLLAGEESRWNEAISKAEAIQLIINTHLAKNELYGYLSEVEYGKINKDKFEVSTEETGETEEIKEQAELFPADPNKVLSSGLTLWEFKAMLDDDEKHVRSLGWTEDEVREWKEEICEAAGTTIEEVNRCPDRPAAAEPKDYVSQPETSQPSPQPAPQPAPQPSPQPSGGSHLPPSIDKDRNGLVDEIEQDVIGEGTKITTTPDPDFYLYID